MRELLLSSFTGENELFVSLVFAIVSKSNFLCLDTNLISFSDEDEVDDSESESDESVSDSFDDDEEDVSVSEEEFELLFEDVVDVDEEEEDDDAAKEVDDESDVFDSSSSELHDSSLLFSNVDVIVGKINLCETSSFSFKDSFCEFIGS